MMIDYDHKKFFHEREAVLQHQREGADIGNLSECDSETADLLNIKKQYEEVKNSNSTAGADSNTGKKPRLMEVLRILGISRKMLEDNNGNTKLRSNSHESFAQREWNASKEWLPQPNKEGVIIESTAVQQMRNSPEYLASLVEMQFYDDMAYRNNRRDEVNGTVRDEDGPKIVKTDDANRESQWRIVERLRATARLNSFD
jgi:hypothetical protein